VTAPLSEFVLLRCRLTGLLYPDYNAPPGILRYCAEGDVIHVKPEDVGWLRFCGLCEEYET